MIIINESFSKYSSATGVRASDLKKMAISPAHFKHSEEKDSASFFDGRLIHTILLEPEELEKRYISEKVDRRTKEGKERYNEILKNGLEIIDNETVDYFKQIPYWLSKNEDAKKYVFDKRFDNECSFYVEKDITTGLPLKCRFDRVDTKNNEAVEIKTVASIDAFDRDVGKFMYHLQQAFYEDVYFYATGNKLKKFVFIAIEKKKPFTSKVFILHPDSVKHGRIKYRKALQQYKDCLISGDWDILPEGRESMIVIPSWYEEPEEDILAFDEKNEIVI
jgi:hypothetical protein